MPACLVQQTPTRGRQRAGPGLRRVTCSGGAERAALQHPAPGIPAQRCRPQASDMAGLGDAVHQAERRLDGGQNAGDAQPPRTQLRNPAPAAGLLREQKRLDDEHVRNPLALVRRQTKRRPGHPRSGRHAGSLRGVPTLGWKSRRRLLPVVRPDLAASGIKRRAE